MRSLGDAATPAAGGGEDLISALTFSPCFICFLFNEPPSLEPPPKLGLTVSGEVVFAAGAAH